MPETFSDLIRDVQDKGKCFCCGGCVSFCSTINSGAIKLDPEGRPVYDDHLKCHECGLCYSICPQTTELDEAVKKLTSWHPPMGKVSGFEVAKAIDPAICENATDGGVVTALLLYLFDAGMIDGAVVSHNSDQGRVPALATTREQILASCGTHFGSSQGMVHLSREYDTFSPSIDVLTGYRKAGLHRLAFVGTPCQINAIRKMQALDIMPADVISFCFGLFCSGNFTFSRALFEQLEKQYQFNRDDVCKINIKDDFIFTLNSGKSVHIPIEAFDSVRRYACRFCDDFSAEYADISFGGLGSEKGWTTAVIRTDAGRQLWTSAVDKVLVSYRYEDNSEYATHAEKKIVHVSEVKKQKAKEHRKAMGE